MYGYSPPLPFQATSTCPWLAQLVSGLIKQTKYNIIIRFRYAY